MMNSLQALIHNELAHGVTGTLLGAASFTITLDDDGNGASCQIDWGDHAPSEQDVVTSFLAGAMLSPQAASAQDLVMLHVVPAQLREAAAQYLQTSVAPVLETFTEDDLTRIGETLQKDGAVIMRRRKVH